MQVDADWQPGKLHFYTMVETERLLLKPLTYDQLTKYIKVDNSLETELNLNESSRSISADLTEAFEQTILPNVANPDKDYLFSTLWTAISKAENCMVADLCFVGEPNENGEVEIGYGTYEVHRNKGYMREAVGGIIGWAIEQPDIKSIVASTEKNNIASFTVLEKNNFIKVGETETMFNWRLTIR